MKKNTAYSLSIQKEIEKHRLTMSETVITIPIDAETARVYHTASSDDQKKIQLMLRLRLRELADFSTGSVVEIMDEIGAKAEARGLTPEILEALLHD